MITNIALENFKCFRHLEVEPRLVTLLIGPNGAGKSGLLQALLLLKQSQDSLRLLNLKGDLVWFAPESFMFHGLNQASNSVRISLSGYWDIGSEGMEGPVEFDAHLNYSHDASLKDGRGRTRCRILGREFEIPFDYTHPRGQFSTGRGSVTYDVGNGINNFIVRAYTTGDEHLTQFWGQVSQVPSSVLDSMKMIPAARALTRGAYQLGHQGSVDISSAHGLGQQEEDIATTLAYSRSDVEKVSGLMKLVTGVGFRTGTVGPVSARPVSESPAGEFSLVAEGFGTNTLVHLLFELSRAVSGATVLIEEPEVHLHPKAQADLASVLAQEAKAARKQIIMTTHSEHIAGRLLTLVAEGQLSPREIAIYSFEKDETGVCSAREIEVTGHGQVTGGLKSFFETDLAEMRRHVEALRARS